MSTSRGRTKAQGFLCATPTCRKPTVGQAQLCPTCKANKRLCRKCGKPHGGPPATTKYCPLCRSIVRRKPRAPYNPPYTEADDAKIRQVYATTNNRNIGKRLREIFPGRPGWSLHRRACTIGCATVRKKEPRWTPEEDAIVQACKWMVPERVQRHLIERGFRRTLTAVSLRMRRTEVRAQIDGYSATTIAKLFDVDIHKVLRWIDRGQLAAQRSGVTGDNHDRWHVTTAAVRDFCFAHPEEIELTKIERAGSKAWFLDLLTHGRISEDGAEPTLPGSTAPTTPPRASAAPAPTQAPGPRTVLLYGEQVTLTALAQMSGRSVAELLHRIDVGGLGPEEAAFGAALPVEEQAAMVMGTASANVAPQIATQIAALVKKHRAKPADLARWTALPMDTIRAVLSGGLTLVSPAVVRMVEVLDAEITISITPRRR